MISLINSRKGNGFVDVTLKRPSFMHFATVITLFYLPKAPWAMGVGALDGLVASNVKCVNTAIRDIPIVQPQT